MKRVNLVQGSPEWHAHRAASRNASDASAMMGASPYRTRAQLLDQVVSGIAPEVDAETQRRFDLGHEIEDKARPFAEGVIGDDLYPVIGCSDDEYLSASFDGLTMDGRIAWECKTYNKSKAEEVAVGEIPEADLWQCVQQLYVSGAEKLLYTLSDGTEEGSVHFWLTRERAQDFFDELLAAWRRFDEDLKTHVPRQAEVKAIGVAPESLPAIHIELTGMVTASNLAEVRDQALAVFRNINRDLQTDEDFANAEKTVKWCGDIEKRLEAAKEHALSQTASISELFSTIDEIKAEARETRLALDKQVKAQKEDRKRTIVMERQQALREHCDKLQVTIGKIQLPQVSADFAGSIKGMRSFSAMEDALDTELANAKIEANRIADHIRTSVEILREEATGHESLFADTQQIVMKQHDDLRNLIKLRISEHKAAEEKRLEAERERIRAEEQAAAERRVQQEREKAEAEQRAKEEAEAKAKREAEEAEQRERAKEEAEEKRLAAEREEQERKESLPEAPVAERSEPAEPYVGRGPAGRGPGAAHGKSRPSDQEIIETLAMKYRVHDSKVIEWLMEMDLEAASAELA